MVKLVQTVKMHLINEFINNTSLSNDDILFLEVTGKQPDDSYEVIYLYKDSFGQIDYERMRIYNDEYFTYYNDLEHLYMSNIRNYINLSNIENESKHSYNYNYSYYELYEGIYRMGNLLFGHFVKTNGVGFNYFIIEYNFILHENLKLIDSL